MSETEILSEREKLMKSLGNHLFIILNILSIEGKISIFRSEYCKISTIEEKA